MDIFLSLLKDNDYHLDKEAKKVVKEMFKNIDNLDGNGRSVRNLFEDIVRHQARRVNSLENISVECLSEIKACDLVLND